MLRRLGKWLWQKKFSLPLFLLLQLPILFLGAFGWLVSVQSFLRILILCGLFAGVETILLRLLLKNNWLILIGGLLVMVSLGADQFNLIQTKKEGAQFLRTCTRNSQGCICDKTQIILPADAAAACRQF